MSAADAVRRFFIQVMIMIRCQSIPQHSEVMILVDQRDVQAGRTWMTVPAIDAASLLLHRIKLCEHGIIPFLLGSAAISEQLAQIPAVTHSRQHRDDARLIEGVLQALDLAQRLGEHGFGRHPAADRRRMAS